MAEHDVAQKNEPTRYPYLVVRYMATVYNSEPIKITVGPPAVEFIERRCIVQHPTPFAADGSVTAGCRAIIIPAVQAAVRKQRSRMCVVWAAESCNYCETDSISESTDSPTGRVQLARLNRKPQPYDLGPLRPRDLAEKVTGLGRPNFEKLVAGIEYAQRTFADPFVVLVWVTHWRGPRRSNDIAGMKSAPDSATALKLATETHESIIGSGAIPESEINANRSAPNLNTSVVPIIGFTSRPFANPPTPHSPYFVTISMGPFPNGLAGVKLVGLFARPAQKL